MFKVIIIVFAILLALGIVGLVKDNNSKIKKVIISMLILAMMMTVITCMAIYSIEAEQEGLEKLANENGSSVKYTYLCDENGLVVAKKRYWYQPYRLLILYDRRQMLVKYKSFFLGEIGGFMVIKTSTSAQSGDAVRPGA